MISHGAVGRADVLEFTVDQPKISADVLLSAMEQAIDPMVVIDEHNLIIFFNAAAEKIWGRTREEVMGRNVSCLVPEPERDRHDDYINRNRETGIGRIVGTSREVEFRRANGEYVCGELSISRV
ncbi:PAS domain S-box protein, partial [Komagataeibacter oboediens]